MTRRIRVVHVITRLELGGAQQNTLYCVRHHDRQRFDVGLIAGRGGLLDDEARSIPDADVQLVPYLRHPLAPAHDAYALARLVRHFRTRRVDIVHTHSSKAGILGRLAARMAGVPVVIHTVHGWSFNDTQSAARRRLYVMLERLCARLTDRLLVVSSPNREKGLALDIGRPGAYRVLHSGIDIAAFAGATGRAEVREELGFGAERIVVGTVANFKAQKAPLDFVAAAAAARRREPRFAFFMAGDGELRAEVERRIRAEGLRDCFRLLGWRRDAVRLFQAMDIYLLTSHFEGLPRSVLQAMAAGVPVVATAVDGTPEVVRDEISGLLVKPGDTDGAARALARLARDAGLRRRCVAGGRSLLGTSFDIDVMVRRLEDHYEELLVGAGVDGAVAVPG